MNRVEFDGRDDVESRLLEAKAHPPRASEQIDADRSLQNTCSNTLGAYRLRFSMSIEFYDLRITLRRNFSASSTSDVSHCHTIKLFHPNFAKSLTLRWSRSALAAIFGLQYSKRDFGNLPFAQPWPCQKHPCTKTTKRFAGKTISGLPGRSRLCSRKRKPALCSAERTILSGPVSRTPTDCMIRRRWSGVRVSATREFSTGYTERSRDRRKAPHHRPSVGNLAVIVVALVESAPSIDEFDLLIA